MPPPPTPSPAPPPEPPTEPPLVARRAKRLDVELASRIRYRGMSSVDVTIRDLAFTGFRAACAQSLAEGERISIDLPPFGLVPATIAWCRGGFIGGLFDSAVDIRHCVLRTGEPSYFSAQRRRTSRSADRLG